MFFGVFLALCYVGLMAFCLLPIRLFQRPLLSLILLLLSHSWLCVSSFYALVRRTLKISFQGKLAMIILRLNMTVRELKHAIVNAFPGLEEDSVLGLRLPACMGSSVVPLEIIVKHPFFLCPLLTPKLFSVLQPPSSVPLSYAVVVREDNAEKLSMKEFSARNGVTDATLQLRHRSISSAASSASLDSFRVFEMADLFNTHNNSSNSRDAFAATLHRYGYVRLRACDIAQLVSVVYASADRFFNQPTKVKECTRICKYDLESICRGHFQEGRNRQYYEVRRESPSSLPVSSSHPIQGALQLFDSLESLSRLLLEIFLERVPAMRAEDVQQAMNCVDTGEENVSSSCYRIHRYNPSYPLRASPFSPFPLSSLSVALSGPPHCDIGLLTVAPRGSCSGLEISLGDGVPYSRVEETMEEDELLIFAGETLSFLTRGYYSPLIHRAVRAFSSRMSIPFFFRGNPHAILTPLSSSSSIDLSLEPLTVHELMLRVRAQRHERLAIPALRNIYQALQFFSSYLKPGYEQFVSPTGFI